MGNRKGRVKGSKNKKSPSWASQFDTASVRSDVGTYERWTQRIGVEHVDEANTIRRETFRTLSLRDRAVDAGGRVTVQAAHHDFEHQALDPLKAAGILNDPDEPRRAQWRLEAGLELLRLYVDGEVMSRSTASWLAVGRVCEGGPRISAEEAEGKAARAEMRFLRARDALGSELFEVARTVCCDMVLPPGLKRSQLLRSLDLLSEFLFDTDPPANIVRPRNVRRPMPVGRIVEK